MGRIAALRCPQCGWEAVTDDTFACGSCEAVLEVRMDLGHLTRSDVRTIRFGADNTLWRWFDFFPVKSRGSVVSLGEGYTPLVRCRRLGEHLGMERLYVKNDTLLPTGSLKDRSNSVGISRAVELGFDTVAVPSTGNAAASVAAYAAAAGLRSVVMVPAGTDAAKVTQAYACGAAVVVVEGESLDGMGALYRAAVKEFGWYDCLSTNPYRNEGKKSYAFELFDQLDEHVPNWIIHPTAGGAGLVAMWKGYQELHGLGWAHRFPRLVAAQSEAAAPIATALNTNSATVEPVAAGATVAESIRVGNPHALGLRALRAVRASNGTGVALPDGEILEAQELLGRLAGVFAEPSAAVSLAAAARLRREGVIRADDMVVCNITGHGLKQVASVTVPPEQLEPVKPELEALKERLEWTPAVRPERSEARPSEVEGQVGEPESEGQP
ncbi:MAG: threonine synthase [Deltaproteobacteria bacterium]|nr:threonine synthase [Deltaproteobacteria bacterium]